MINQRVKHGIVVEKMDGTTNGCLLSCIEGFEDCTTGGIEDSNVLCLLNSTDNGWLFGCVDGCKDGTMEGISDGSVLD
jgi:hypothetical protein